MTQPMKIQNLMKKKPWKFAKMLVVDECSMVDVTTFNKLLKVLLEETSLCKVVLVGDIRQLPSIERGNFFEDIFRVASEYDFGVDLTINHRFDSGGRSMGKNAEKISRGKMPKFDEETSGIPKNDDSRFLLSEVPLEETGPNDGRTEGRAREATIGKLKELLESKLTGMEDVTTSQIITFTRNLVKHANNVCAQHYNSRSDNDKRETGKLDFREGDKTCCRKNCLMENPFYNPKVGDSNTGAGFYDGNHLNRGTPGDVPQPDGIENEYEATINEMSYRIFNGDTFTIKKLDVFWDDGTSSWKPAALLNDTALLNDMESNRMWVDLSAFRRTGKAEHAWCRTIHTFQGSEVETVVYLISSHKKESRKHVYTAVTRGKGKVIVIGPKKYLSEALRTNFKRDTGLKGFFQKELEKWQREQMSAMKASREEDASISAKRDTEMGVPFIPGVGLKNTKVNGYNDSHLHEDKSVCTEKGDDDNKDSGTQFTELRDSQHKQVLSVEGSPPPPPPPPARILISEELQKRKIRPERPKQEVKYVKSQLSPSKEIAPTKRLRQTFLNFPKVINAPKLLKPISKNSTHLAVADSLPPPPPPTPPSVGEVETDLPLESKEFGNQSPMSPMDNDQEVKEWNHSGARKRLKCPSASHPGPTKSAKK